MVQEILVYLIIAGSVIYAAYLLHQKFSRKKTKSCDNCEGCPLKEM